MGIQEYIIKNIGMPLMTRVKGWPVTRYLRELEESQWWTAAQLAEMQNEKLRAVVRHAYETVQYYRELLDSIGLKPDDIKSVADLPKIPILTKDAVKANYPDRMASNLFRAKDVVECSSSGSTGVPLKYWTSLEEKGLMWGVSTAGGAGRVGTWAGSMSASRAWSSWHSRAIRRLRAWRRS